KDVRSRDIGGAVCGVEGSESREGVREAAATSSDRCARARLLVVDEPNYLADENGDGGRTASGRVTKGEGEGVSWAGKAGGRIVGELSNVWPRRGHDDNSALGRRGIEGGDGGGGNTEGGVVNDGVGGPDVGRLDRNVA